MHTKSRFLLASAIVSMFAAVVFIITSFSMAYNNPDLMDDTYDPLAKEVQHFSLLDEAMRSTKQAISMDEGRRNLQDEAEEDVDWTRLVMRTNHVGIKSPYPANLYDDFQWAYQHHNKTEVPKIIGIVFWYDNLYVFRGLQAIYRDQDVRTQMPLEHRVEKNQQQQGRIIYMFADDEYITDVKGRKLGNWIRDIQVVTNRGTYDSPSTKGVGYFTLSPQATSWRNNHVFIGFGGQYNHKHQHYLYGIYVDMDQLSTKQMERFFEPDQENGPVEEGYSARHCEPRSAAEIKWGLKQGIDHICDAAIDDPRIYWRDVAESQKLFVTENVGTDMELSTYGNLDQISKYTDWHEVPMVTGVSFFNNQGRLTGIGFEIDNKIDQNANECQNCGKSFYKLDSEELIMQIDVTSDSIHGFKMLRVVTTKRNIIEYSHYGQDSGFQDTQSMFFMPNERPVAFRATVKNICNTDLKRPDNYYVHQQTGDQTLDSIGLAFGLLTLTLDATEKQCVPYNMFGLEIFKIDINAFHDTQKEKFLFSPFT